MDRWKAEMGRVSQEKRRRKRKSQKEDLGVRKGRKFAKNFIFPVICGSGGSKSRLAKAAGAEPAGEMRDEKLHAAAAHFQVKMYKTPQLRSTFRSCDVEKVHAVVARSTFGSQNVQSTPGPTTFGSWDVEKVHAVVARSTFGSQNVQSTPGPTTFGSWDVEKVHAVVARSTFRSQNVQSAHQVRPLFGSWDMPLWREAHFEVKMLKTAHVRATFGSWDVEKVHAVAAHHFWTFRCRFAWQAQGILHLVKSEQNVRVLWHFQKPWQAWDIWRGSAKMQYFIQVEWKNHKTHWYEAISSALNFPFLKEVSQNCFVFDVVNFENWRSLPELLRFWCCHCQVQKLRKSRRIVSFLTLLSSKIEEVSQNCFVFDVVKFKNWGNLADLLRFQAYR